MSEKYKPSEILKFLLQQLKRHRHPTCNLTRWGNVLASERWRSTYLTVLRNAEANEFLEFENGIMAIVMKPGGGQCRCGIARSY